MHPARAREHAHRLLEREHATDPTPAERAHAPAARLARVRFAVWYAELCDQLGARG